MNRTTTQPTIPQEPVRLQPWRLPEAAWGWHASPPGLAALAGGFTPISLDQMNAVALLNRTETKYLMSKDQLLSALSALQQDYWILAVKGERLNHYRTLYFDTPDFELYNLHVNGHADRYKVRSREYTDSRLSFLEVKHKTSKGRTIKDRISTAQPVVQMNPDAENWLHGVCPYGDQALEPKIWNTYTRVTLVSKQSCERVTLDVDLTFYTAEKAAHLDGIAIAEVKLEAGCSPSIFAAQMRAQRIHPRGFSKYCLGVSMLYDQVKKNSLKPKLRWIEKISRGIDHE